MDCEDEDETKDERQFNSHQQSLNRLSKRIRNLLDEVKLGLECLHYITRQLCGHGPSIREYESPPTISRLDAPDELQVLSYKEAMAEAHLKTIITSLQSLIKLKLSGAPLLYSDATYHPPPRDFRPGDEPKLSDPLQDDVILLRIHTRNSMSPYDDQVGFRCSKWKDVSFGDEPILDDFIEHMDSTVHPSPYISIFESAARLLEHIAVKPGNQWAGRIMAISKKRLSLLGISATKSTELQSKFEVPNPDRSAGPGNTDWLVKYWIPKEAIVDEMSVERFVGLAKTYQIVNSKKSENVKCIARNN